MMPCSLVEVSWHLRGSCSLHHEGRWTSHVWKGCVGMRTAWTRAELWQTQWDMGRSESGEKHNGENRAVCEWSEQESRGGNSEGRNKKREENSRAEKEFPVLLHFNIPVLICTRFPFLGVFGKLQKATVGIVMSVSLSVYLSTWNNSAPSQTGQIAI